MNIDNRFTERATRAIELARKTAISLGQEYIGSEHLLLGLLEVGDGKAAEALAAAGVTGEKVVQVIGASRGRGAQLADDARAELTPRAKRSLEFAVMAASRMKTSYVGTEHILLGLLAEGDNVAARILASLGVDLRALYGSLVSGEAGQEPQMHGQEYGGGGAGKTSTKTIEKFGRDLTRMAKEGKLDPVIGRDAEIERVIQILSRRQKNNPALIGEPGVGKTAVAEGLALKIVSGDVAEPLMDKRVITMDLSSMVAGSKYRGEFEERIKTAIEEVIKAKNIILFIDEMHTIIGAGGAEGAIDAANILKPALSRGELQVIGATTLDEYRRHIEKDAALERRFQPITVNEPSPENTVLILKGLRDKYEAHHKIKISDEAIEEAVKLSVRYISDRFLPDKAIDLIDESASRLRISSLTAPPAVKELTDRLEAVLKEKEEAVGEQNYEKAARLRDEEKTLNEKLAAEKNRVAEKRVRDDLVLTGADIAGLVAGITGIPLKTISGDESERLLKLEDSLHERLVGQNEAVTAVSKAIRRGRVGLKDPKRPIGSFIFLGPTGVGKTELAKALAEALFGDEGAMIRVDMSELMEKHAVSKLIGSPPGYVGYDEGGQLTEKIRRKPYSVVLFDEIEKAHPDVMNLLLQILDDGILTDSQGRKIDFKNTVIIMTSNAGASRLSEHRPLGFVSQSARGLSDEEIKSDVMGEMKRLFKPEFLNRVDDIIVFKPLTEEEISTIAEKLLKTVRTRVSALGINLIWKDEVTKLLAKTGFDPLYGARPLKRVIQSTVEDLISESVLSGRIARGLEVTLEVRDEKITIAV